MREASPLPPLLDAVAAELTRLHERALDLQCATGPLAAEGGASAAATALQDLDRLTQDLTGLSDYVSALAERSQAGWCVDGAEALETVTLASLADRLSPEAARASDGGDDVELFGMTG